MVYIAPTAFVTNMLNIKDEAKVHDYATVDKHSILLNESQIYGTAKIASNSTIKTVILIDNCHVFGNANLDISHLPSGLKIIFGKGCKIGGQFDMRRFINVESFIYEYKDRKELSSHYDRRGFNILSVKLTDVWVMG